MEQRKKPRMWEIDVTRGLFVTLMIVYHAGWDLEHFGIYTGPPLEQGWILAIRQVIGGLFIALVGISFVLTEQRRHDPGRRNRTWRERGVKLWVWGVLISGVTALVIRDRMVHFGILHLIGTAYLIAPALLRLGRATGVLGLLLLALRLVVREIDVEGVWLLPFGLSPQGYASVDYFPLIPWLGPILLGIAFARFLYPALGERRFALPETAPSALRPFVWAGRHALILYIVHQPLLFLIFALFGFTLW